MNVAEMDAQCTKHSPKRDRDSGNAAHPGKILSPQTLWMLFYINRPKLLTFSFIFKNCLQKQDVLSLFFLFFFLMEAVSSRSL